MKIQLWSYNYSPEPTGIAPVSTTWAQAMRARGHEIDVVAAHPHYPEPQWGKSRKPYRERIDGISVLRLPLWIGRESGFARIRQDATFAASLSAAIPFLGHPDAAVVVSPSFPALAPAILNGAIRRMPWLLWLQDILPDGAISTGLSEQGATVEAARKLELRSYRSSDQIVVISERFRENLLEKGVPPEKISLIYNPTTLPAIGQPAARNRDEAPRILVMGNIGHSQGLAAFVRRFEDSQALADLGASLIITGAGVAADETREAISTDRVEMLGLVSQDELEAELDRATMGLVSQRTDFPEFNLPSKLMNYLARGLPVLASVGKESEVANLVRSAGAGWVLPDDSVEALDRIVAPALRSPDELISASERGIEFARQKLTPDAIAAEFERVLERSLPTAS